MENILNTEERTFNVLRRCPINEICDELVAYIFNRNHTYTNLPHMIALHNQHQNQYTVIHKMKEIEEIENIIERTGWTFGELYNEINKNAARANIDEINQQHTINSDILNQIKEVFPDVKITPFAIKE
jgi:hypothetical protein